MSQKLPPLIRPLAVESLRFYATRRMLWVVLALGLSVAIPTAASRFVRPVAAPAMEQVPQMEWTTDATRGAAPMLAMAAIPSRPGPNQKRPKDCDPRRSEVAINGGCWVQTTHALPCPEGVQWEHEGKCWLPVAYARPVPQAAEPMQVNIAGEE